MKKMSMVSGDFEPMEVFEPPTEVVRREQYVVIRNLVFDRQGRMHKRSPLRLKTAWQVLRGWRVYYG